MLKAPTVQCEEFFFFGGGGGRGVWELEFMLSLLNLITFIISIETEASLLALAKSIYYLYVYIQYQAY